MASITADDELVLTVPVEELYSRVGPWRGIRKPANQIWQVIAKKASFKKRSLVESDPRFKQLISYTLFVSGDLIFLMQRFSSQSEQRLTGKLSVGVGGHMNPVPGVPWPGRRRLTDIRAIVSLNTIREIKEEVVLAGNPQLGLMGFLNDDENEVGKVHLGVVSVVNMPKPILAVRETDKMSGTWVDLAEASKALNLESWSDLVLNGPLTE